MSISIVSSSPFTIIHVRLIAKTYNLFVLLESRSTYGQLKRVCKAHQFQIVSVLEV